MTRRPPPRWRSTLTPGAEGGAFPIKLVPRFVYRKRAASFGGRIVKLARKCRSGSRYRGPRPVRATCRHRPHHDALLVCSGDGPGDRSRDAPRKPRVLGPAADRFTSTAARATSICRRTSSSRLVHRSLRSAYSPRIHGDALDGARSGRSTSQSRRRRPSTCPCGPASERSWSEGLSSSCARSNSHGRSTRSEPRESSKECRWIGRGGKGAFPARDCART